MLASQVVVFSDNFETGIRLTLIFIGGGAIDSSN
jgi:hypothetical protein